MVSRRPSRLPLGTQVQLLEHFIVGTPARTAAGLVEVNRHTATLFYQKLREVIVFGLLKRGGRVHAVMIPDVRKTTILPIVRRRITPDSIVYTDALRSYDTLTVAGFRHQRINHKKGFGIASNHINGIENFWNQAKRHLRRFNGIPRPSFPLFLAECEGRFNYGPAPKLRKILSQWANIPHAKPGSAP